MNCCGEGAPRVKAALAIPFSSLGPGGPATPCQHDEGERLAVQQEQGDDVLQGVARGACTLGVDHGIDGNGDRVGHVFSPQKCRHIALSP